MSSVIGPDGRSSSKLLRAAGFEYVAPDVLDTEAITAALNSLCTIACHIANAPTALIAQRNPLTSRIQVRGRLGTLVNEVDMSFVLPDLDPDRQPMIAAPDIRNDRRFEDHPILRLMPHMKSLIAMLVPGCDRANRAVLKVINPSRTAIADGHVHQMLSEVCMIAGDLFRLEREARPISKCSCQTSLDMAEAAVGFAQGLQEEAAVFGSVGISASFLLETLVKKRTLHARNGADYVTLRTWRAALKKYQIAALTGLKAAPPALFVAAVAEEIVANMRRTHGEGAFRSVIPIPPGSSGATMSLSVLLAQAVADRLGATMRHALAGTGVAEIGKSSPRKSGRLSPYHLSEPVPGPILIVDDVASSGRHIELAVEACRTQGTAVHAIAWIGQ